MKPFRLMHLFRHIAQKTTCPYCKEKISPDQIHVDASSDESAFLTIHCLQCEQDLHAHVFVNFSEPEMIIKAESKQGDITPQEIEHAQSILEAFDGNIASLFSSQE